MTYITVSDFDLVKGKIRMRDKENNSFNYVVTFILLVQFMKIKEGGEVETYL